MNTALFNSSMPLEEQAQVITKLWGAPGSPCSDRKPPNAVSYLQRYSWLCQRMNRDYGGKLPVRAPEEFMEVIDDLHQGLTKSEVYWNLSRRMYLSRTEPMVDTKPYGRELLYVVINIAAAVITTLNIDDRPYESYQRPYPGAIVWADESFSLKQFTKLQFDPTPKRSCNDAKFDSHFTASNLDKISGVRVHFTPYLNEHLKIIRKKPITIGVFQHATMLKNQHSDIFPDGLVEETLLTLALLFPQGDQDAEKFYRKKNKWWMNLDPEILDCGAPDQNIDSYHYWRDRLLALKEIFEESKQRPPTSTRFWRKFEALGRTVHPEPGSG